MTICQRPRTQLLLISYVSMCAASLGLKEQNKWMWTHTPLPRGSRHRSPSGNSTGGCDAQGTLYKQSFEGPPFVPVLCNVGPWSVGPRRCGVRWQRGGGGANKYAVVEGVGGRDARPIQKETCHAMSATSHPFLGRSGKSDRANAPNQERDRRRSRPPPPSHPRRSTIRSQAPDDEANLIGAREIAAAGTGRSLLIDVGALAAGAEH